MRIAQKTSKQIQRERVAFSIADQLLEFLLGSFHAELAKQGDPGFIGKRSKFYLWCSGLPKIAQVGNRIARRDDAQPFIVLGQRLQQSSHALILQFATRRRSRSVLKRFDAVENQQRASLADQLSEPFTFIK